MRYAVLILALCSSLWGQTFVQAKGGNNSGTNVITVTPTSAITAGDAVIAAWMTTTNTTMTVSIADNLSESYTQASCGYYANGTSVTRMSLFYLPNSGAATSVTATASATSNSRLVVIEVSGAALSSLEDGTCTGKVDTGSDASLSATAYTTTNAKDILVYCVGLGSSAGGFTAPAGFTINSGALASTNFACAYEVVSSIQTGITPTMTWVTAGPSTGILGGFKGATAAVVPRRRTNIF